MIRNDYNVETFLFERRSVFCVLQVQDFGKEDFLSLFTVVQDFL